MSETVTFKSKFHFGKRKRKTKNFERFQLFTETKRKRILVKTCSFRKDEDIFFNPNTSKRMKIIKCKLCFRVILSIQIGQK